MQTRRVLKHCFEFICEADFKEIYRSIIFCRWVYRSRRENKISKNVVRRRFQCLPGAVPV